MIIERVKKLAERIRKATCKDEGAVYYVKYLNGVYTCADPEMIWADEAAFCDWENTLQGDNTIIIDNIEDAIKHPESLEERKAKGLLTVREAEEDLEAQKQKTELLNRPFKKA